MCFALPPYFYFFILLPFYPSILSFFPLPFFPPSILLCFALDFVKVLLGELGFCGVGHLIPFAERDIAVN